MFDMMRCGNAKQGLVTGLKTAVPFKKQEVCRNLSSCVHSLDRHS